jgi:hypothetical protein
MVSTGCYGGKKEQNFSPKWTDKSLLCFLPFEVQLTPVAGCTDLSAEQ